MGQLVLTICDHDHPDDRVEAEHHEITIDGTTVQVDLCPEHGKPVLELLEELRLVGRVEGLRRRRTPAAAKPGEFDCPECERTFPTAQGVAGHRGMAHGAKVGQHQGPMSCPLCGKEFPNRSNVMQHLRGKTTHNLSFEDARDEVAKVLTGA